MGEPARKSKPDLQIVRPAPGFSLDYYIGIFLDAKSGKSPKTLRGYTSILRLFRNHVGPHAWPPTPEHIDSFLNDCKGRGLKEATVDTYYCILKSWCNWLYRRGWLDKNPIVLAEKPPHPRSLPRAPRLQVLQEFFDRLKVAARKGHWLDVRALALWGLAVDTGLRIGELTALTVNDVTLEKRRKSAFVKGAKTYQDRTVHFHKRTAKELKHWIKVRAELPLPPGLDALFICYVRGKWKPLTSWGARQALSRRCEEWGLPHLRPHDFRHAHAVYWIREHGDLLDLQRQLGHTNLSTTERYTRVEDEERGKRHKKRSIRRKL